YKRVVLRARSLGQIPPTQLVDRSYSTYKAAPSAPRCPNPTNAVGGSLILSLQGERPARLPQIPPTQLVDGSYSAYIAATTELLPESHQRSWWMVHPQPT